jgi:hypothetical protein
MVSPARPPIALIEGVFVPERDCLALLVVPLLSPHAVQGLSCCERHWHLCGPASLPRCTQSGDEHGKSWTLPVDTQAARIVAIRDDRCKPGPVLTVAH